MLEGKVTEILGHMDDPGVDILSILRAYNLPQEFPEEVMKQVRKIPQEIRVSEEILLPRPCCSPPESGHPRESSGYPESRFRCRPFHKKYRQVRSYSW